MIKAYLKGSYIRSHLATAYFMCPAVQGVRAQVVAGMIASLTLLWLHKLLLTVWPSLVVGNSGVTSIILECCSVVAYYAAQAKV